MEPVACQALLENPSPHDKDSDSPSPPVCIGKVRRGAVQGKASTLYLKLLSLRLGLMGWYCCLKKIQWDMVQWIHISLELATDVFFSWVQNALLASMMLLLLAWKLHSGVKQHGWRTLLWSLRSNLDSCDQLHNALGRSVGTAGAGTSWSSLFWTALGLLLPLPRSILTSEVQYVWGRSLLRDYCCNLKSFVVQAAWGPACCFSWIICYLVRALEAIFAQAVMMAGEDQVEEATEETLPESASPHVFQHEEQALSSRQ